MDSRKVEAEFVSSITGAKWIAIGRAYFENGKTIIFIVDAISTISGRRNRPVVGTKNWRSAYNALLQVAEAELVEEITYHNHKEVTHG